jgi:4-diphosphocytidyl-2-C-methyl-D-erythritol kinase
MVSCSLLACAKVNFYIEILGHRSDGYHEVRMILQSIDLADRIHLDLIETGILIECQHPEVPTDQRNLAYRAAELLQKTYGSNGSKGGVRIQIEKNIPVAAGLAGGSTNAAAVLVGLNYLWDLKLSQVELEALAAKLGSDIPFCLLGGTQLATGRGEILQRLPDLPVTALVLAKHYSLGISTAWAYQTYRLLKIAGQMPDAPANGYEFAFNRPDPVTVAQHLYNALEHPVLSQHPEISHLKEKLVQAGALGSLMSGSGPTVFAVMPSMEMALKAQQELSRDYPEIQFWATQTTSTGIQFQDLN